jgi:hypothetical protein
MFYDAKFYNSYFSINRPTSLPAAASVSAAMPWWKVRIVVVFIHFF